MDAERFGLLEEILEEVWQAPVEERGGILDRRCGDDDSLRREAERLLALDREDSFMEVPAIERSPIDESDISTSFSPTLASDRPAPATAESSGTRIGSYEILRPLGAGGMGSVYLARRHDDVHRQEVALKILTDTFHDAGARERFHGEREILAHLSHPNIARLLDGGTTEDGRPYLVMEWVDGEPIDKYCRRRALSLEARLELFVKVCGAVQEAHRALIVHRDLKPANILVDSRGEPKLLDFGIAKLLRPEALARTMVVTATGSQPLTPAYASPEQVTGGAITTAVDVYALGILLYELLTAERPYDLTGVHLVEALRRITSQEPLRPSERLRQGIERGDSGPAETIAEARQLERRVRGDLDAIVGMSLRKEPERRYASAESLREDVERHLDGRPVKAADDSWSYRLLKFVRRHRTGVAAASLVVLLVVGFMAIVLAQRQQVTMERNRATFTSGFLLDLFIGVDPWSVEARDPSAAEMLDRGRRSLDSRETEAPDQADLLHTIGRAYLGIGRYRESEDLLRRALDARRRLHGERHAEVAETMAQLAEALRWQGEIDDALALARGGYELYRELGLDSSRQGVLASLQLADMLDLLGRYREAEDYFDQAVDTAGREGHGDLEAIALHRLGMAKRRLHLYGEALAAMEESVERHVGTFGRAHPRTAHAQTELGTIRLALGDLDGARRAFEEAEETQRQLLGEDHPEFNRVIVRQGQLALHVGDHPRAEERLSRAEASLRESVGAHPMVADLLVLKSWMLFLQGLPEPSAEAAREALEISRRLLGPRHVDTVSAEHRLAMAIAQGGDVERARRLMTEALATIEELTGPSSPRSVTLRGDLGWIEVLARRMPEAEENLEEAIETLENFYGRRHMELAKLHNNLAMVKHGMGKLEEAEGEYRAALDIGADTLGERAPFFGALHTNLARLLEATSRFEQAGEVLDQATAIYDRAGLGPEHLWRLHADRIRAKIGIRQARHRQVQALLEPWLEVLAENPQLNAAERYHTSRLAVANLEAWGRPAEAAELKRRFGLD